MSYRVAFPAGSWIEARAKPYSSGSRAEEFLLHVACCFSRVIRIKPLPLEVEERQWSFSYGGSVQLHEAEEQILQNQPSHKPWGYLSGFFSWFYSACDHISLAIWKKKPCSPFPGTDYSCNALFAAAESPPWLNDLAADRALRVTTHMPTTPYSCLRNCLLVWGWNKLK